MTRVLRVWFQPPSQLSQCSFWITPEMTCVMSWIAIHKKQLRRTCCTPGIFFGDVYNCEMPISSLWRHELRLKFYTFLTRAPLFPSLWQWPVFLLLFFLIYFKETSRAERCTTAAPSVCPSFTRLCWRRSTSRPWRRSSWKVRGCSRLSKVFFFVGFHREGKTILIVFSY